MRAMKWLIVALALLLVAPGTADAGGAGRLRLRGHVSGDLSCTGAAYPTYVDTTTLKQVWNNRCTAGLDGTTPVKTMVSNLPTGWGIDPVPKDVYVGACSPCTVSGYDFTGYHLIVSSGTTLTIQLSKFSDPGADHAFLSIECQGAPGCATVTIEDSEGDYTNYKRGQDGYASGEAGMNNSGGTLNIVRSYFHSSYRNYITNQYLGTVTSTDSWFGSTGICQAGSSDSGSHGEAIHEQSGLMTVLRSLFDVSDAGGTICGDFTSPAVYPQHAPGGGGGASNASITNSIITGYPAPNYIDGKDAGGAPTKTPIYTLQLGYDIPDVLTMTGVLMEKGISGYIGKLGTSVPVDGGGNRDFDTGATVNVATQ